MTYNLVGYNLSSTIESNPGPLQPPFRGHSMSKKNTAWNRLLMVLVIAHLSGVVLPATGAGQTIPGGAPSELRSPVTISPIEPLSAPTSRFSANLITPSTTNRLKPSADPTNQRNAFPSAGRGLPGMPGGPLLNSSTGAQDPTGRYMRPPVIGPLFCDPGIDSC